MRFSRRLIMVCLLVTVSLSALASPPSTVSYQGRLTDAGGSPVPDGSYSVRFSLWTDSTLGSESWSETQTVAVNGGLFSAELGRTSGFFDICPTVGCDDWLQIEATIGGVSTTLLPRLHLAATPWSLVSRSLYTEETSGSARARGIIVKKPVGGSPSGLGMQLLFDADSDGDGVPESEMSQSVTPTTSHLAIKTKGTSAQRISSATTADSAAQVVSSDADGDGDDDGEVSMIVTPTTSGVAIKTKGTGADANRVLVIQQGATPSDLLSSSTIDEDGDTVPESEISESLTPTTCGVAINTKGTGADKGRTIGIACDDSSAIQTFEVDDDGNGHAEAHANIAAVLNGSVVIGCAADPDDDGDDDGEVSMKVTPTTCGVAIKTKGTGADANRVLSIQHGATPSEIISSSAIDEDGDTVPESKISESLTPTTCSVAINTKGTGADKNRTIGITCDDSSATQTVEADVNGDGVAEFSASSVVNDTSAQSSVSRPSDVAGNHRDGWNVMVVDGSSRTELKTYFETGDVPTQEQFVDASGSTFRAINTTGTGATVRVGMSATDSAKLVSEHDADSDGHVEHSGVIKSDLDGSGVDFFADPDDDGDADVSAVTAVTDDSATIRLNGLPPGVPVTETIAMTATPTGVHMEVGAATCDGTNWTNASDKNAKENFEQVDGAELLEKIESLPITQWNYKQDSENVKHIGPTAQDFKSTFGVGANDKSISTIDPSGIALAAIKQLIKENEDLRKRMAKLEEELRQSRTK